MERGFCCYVQADDALYKEKAKLLNCVAVFELQGEERNQGKKQKITLKFNNWQ